eukprot:CAMPEP_0206407924 /NCGR_PEP_ID=MMETSP0294-20121207/30809_1 /ASSEMBLY_ACC=CAM_ASM_000327 /TAXON_ID=39354 /ORGANISM="Heterosigma akashiwo, Strain CCMP2393" /LENGTH=129 /DNA_ID=CAMNT_0053867217 /DNA_START=678 /DNA_END=1067 /DNA_ORIENTATION=+
MMTGDNCGGVAVAAATAYCAPTLLAPSAAPSASLIPSPADKEQSFPSSLNPPALVPSPPDKEESLPSSPPLPPLPGCSLVTSVNGTATAPIKKALPPRRPAVSDCSGIKGLPLLGNCLAPLAGNSAFSW